MQNVEIQPKVTFDSSLAPNSAVAKANVNIALIKYWGKRDERLILPYTSSLSLTLSDLYATTSVHFDESLSADFVTLDGFALPTDDSTRLRVVAMLDLVREKAGISTKAKVVSHNHVPIAAGLASSASGSAALAAAASYAAGLNLTPRELSRLARRGSGSACRSIFGGFVLWNKGEDDETSYAEPIADLFADPLSEPAEPADSHLPASLLAQKNLNPAMIVVTLDSSKKPISSRTAMRRTVETSPAYMPWVEQSKKDLARALDAIRVGSIEQLGEVMEQNSLGMHETMRKANPPVNYLTDKTYAVLNAVCSMRECGWPVWATMDAGPNVKVLTDAGCAARAAEELRGRVAESAKFTIALPGDGVSVSASLKQAAKL
ncbi:MULTISPECIES: diphosphomevalonate decarboxylase [Gardnerella]|uniref:diphosphomevalonate decarboxylase n=1 Tax=Gardnerella greenwoodii 00703Dmash TaxID=698960 RepID=I4M8Y9_9BIFI|nr:diphosphomevalonate decarboxylase [Gardnerella greenwoodii]EIK85679.1 diphosphomevalonate decarboxylase [Gardnerella greenwoodii 00703Dmash]